MRSIRDWGRSPTTAAPVAADLFRPRPAAAGGITVPPDAVAARERQRKVQLEPDCKGMAARALPGPTS